MSKCASTEFVWNMEDLVSFHTSNPSFHSILGPFHIPYRYFLSIPHSIPYHSMPWPHGVENHQQTYWHFWMLLSPVPRFCKLHRHATREERGTEDRGSRVHQDGQQGAVHLSLTVSLNPLGRRSLLLPSDA